MENPSNLSSTMTTTTTNTSPTTFVQADTSTFRDLVQKLTGANPSSTTAAAAAATTSTSTIAPRRPSFKLQERRHTMRKLEIKLGLTSLSSSKNSFSPRSHQLISPNSSPVTPLGSDRLFSSSSSQFSVYGPTSTSSSSDSPLSSPSPTVSEEEKAIAQKGFYLHPSPLNTPRPFDPPELLPLFPLRSPRQSD